MIISLKERVGEFAENKDLAREIRQQQLLPALQKKERVVLDFSGIDGATQSFIHALISEPIRTYGPEVLEHVLFKNCNKSLKKLIALVTEYLQESM